MSKGSRRGTNKALRECRRRLKEEESRKTKKASLQEMADAHFRALRGEELTPHEVVLDALFRQDQRLVAAYKAAWKAEKDLRKATAKCDSMTAEEKERSWRLLEEF